MLNERSGPGADAESEAIVGDPPHVIPVRDPASGLDAVIVIDDETLGPAAGGIRTQAYPDRAAAIADARKLATAMTLKCAIAGLDAGGGKTVVIDHPSFDRVAGFRHLGRVIENLGGRYRSAGDLGTTVSDLAHAAEATTYVNTSGEGLGEATAATVLNGIRACLDRHGGNLSGLRVAVQGCGLIGSNLVRMLRREGADVLVADVDSKRAKALADECGCIVAAPDEILAMPVDIVAPCATGGTLTAEAIGTIRAWAICGGANNQIADAEALAVLTSSGILYVPDFLASAGGVIHGMTMAAGGNPEPIISRVRDTVAGILDEAVATREAPPIVAERHARARIAARRAERDGWR